MAAVRVDWMHGTVLGDGADGVTWRPDGAIVIDGRLAPLTHDDALITMRNVGLLYARTPDARAGLQHREVIADED